jgi:RNA polymerase sigma factor (sigma-70 family)
MAERKMRQDSAEVVARLFDAHVWDVYGFLAYRVGNRAEAEDLTQQTFERALRSWGRFDPDRAQPKTWLLAIARNLLIDHYRRDRSTLHRPLGEEGIADDQLPAVEGPEESGVSAELSDALATLRDRDREIVALRFGADLRGPEIAELLSLTLANVQQILSRSLRKLRAELEAADHAVGRGAPRRSGGERPDSHQTGGGNHEKQRAARRVAEDQSSGA